MSTHVASRHVASTSSERISLSASAGLTYAVGLWITLGNPYIARMIGHPPISWSNLPPWASVLLQVVLLAIGRTPCECLWRIAVIGFLVQSAIAFTIDGPEIDMERYRPYVFWRAIYRFLAACAPFLRGRRLDAPPSTSLTEYERVTVRYFFVKLIFMPMMIGFFFGNLQALLNVIDTPFGPAILSANYIRNVYLLIYRLIILVDVAWFCIGCSIETDRFSPIKTVEPYASGWLVTLACYPPLVFLSGQLLTWSAPEFPAVFTSQSALFYAIAGLVLFLIYVSSDFCFGLKCGNLLYRGLVDKGPYRWVRHPMYTSKNLAWILFTVPMLNFHWQWSGLRAEAWHTSIPLVAANWALLPPMIAWVSIYALRGITEERYLLAFPEYREYCKRVRYRFIPGVM